MLKCSNCQTENPVTMKFCGGCGRSLTEYLYAMESQTNRSNLYHCPQCKSDNTSSFPMIFQSGTSVGKMSAVSYNPNIGVIGTGGTSKSQSLLAKQLAPPSLKYTGCGHLVIAGIVGALAFSIVNIFAAAMQVQGLAIIAVTGGLATFIGILIYFGKENERQNIAIRKQIQLWNRSWMCLKCGNSWAIPANQNK